MRPPRLALPHRPRAAAAVAPGALAALLAGDAYSALLDVRSAGEVAACGPLAPSLALHRHHHIPLVHADRHPAPPASSGAPATAQVRPRIRTVPSRGAGQADSTHLR